LAPQSGLYFIERLVTAVVIISIYYVKHVFSGQKVQGRFS
jgi:hypothetical protein